MEDPGHIQNHREHDEPNPETAQLWQQRFRKHIAARADVWIGLVNESRLPEKVKSDLRTQLDMPVGFSGTYRQSNFVSLVNRSLDGVGYHTGSDKKLKGLYDPAELDALISSIKSDIEAFDRELSE
jgi:hypothetical protein